MTGGIRCRQPRGRFSGRLQRILRGGPSPAVPVRRTVQHDKRQPFLQSDTDGSRRQDGVWLVAAVDGLCISIWR